jgi:hypothetical protein
VPDAKDKTVASAFAEELPRLIELPDDDFPVEERVVVTSGKTPYVRFDRNDYSVPHTHVCRALTVLASDDRVRVVDPEAPTEILADHKRSFDRDQRIEHEGHVRALVEEKRRAHQSRGFDRLFSAAPSTRTMMERLAERGANLGAATSGLLQLLDRVAPNCSSAPSPRSSLGISCSPAPCTSRSTVCGTRPASRRRSRCPSPTTRARTRRCARTRYRPTTGSTPKTTEGPMATADKLPETLKRLRLFGLLARIEEVRNKPWLEEVVAIEFEEKTRRSLAHRQHLAGIGAFKPVSSFDWKWPRKIDRPLIEELFTLGFIAEGANVVLLGPNGVGKTMILRNLADRALNAGHHVVVRTASDLLADLIKQESSVARARRLAAYVRAHLLCIDSC